jgi:hypothetical protein
VGRLRIFGHRKRGRHSETGGLTLGSVAAAGQTRSHAWSAANSRTCLRSASSVQRRQGRLSFLHGTLRSLRNLPEAKSRHGPSVRAVIRITGPQKNIYHALEEMLAARGISVTHETIWQWPTPRETCPCRVAWGSAQLNLIHPYHPRSCAGCFATELARPTNPLIGHSPLGIDGGDEAVKASRPKSSSQVTLCWREMDSNYRFRVGMTGPWGHGPTRIDTSPSPLPTLWLRRRTARS